MPYYSLSLRLRAVESDYSDVLVSGHDGDTQHDICTSIRHLWGRPNKPLIDMVSNAYASLGFDPLPIYINLRNKLASRKMIITDSQKMVGESERDQSFFIGRV